MRNRRSFGSLLEQIWDVVTEAGASLLIREKAKLKVNLLVLSWLLGGPVNRIINLQRPQSLSFHWWGNWSPARLGTMTHPKRQRETPGRRHFFTGAGPLTPVLPPSLPSSLWLLLSRGPTSQSQFPEASFQGRQELRLHSHMVDHWEGHLQPLLLRSAPQGVASVTSCAKAWAILSARSAPLKTFNCFKQPWGLYLGSLGDAKALSQDPFPPSLGEWAFQEKATLRDSSHFSGIRNDQNWLKMQKTCADQ